MLTMMHLLYREYRSNSEILSNDIIEFGILIYKLWPHFEYEQCSLIFINILKPEVPGAGLWRETRMPDLQCLGSIMFTGGLRECANLKHWI